MTSKGKALKGGMRKQKTIVGQFAWRLVEMLEAPAYRALSLSGHRVLARLEIELGGHGGNENGSLKSTFDDFEDYGIHRQAIAPAIREVVALGFVEIVERGRAGNSEWRRPSLYRLTYRHTDVANPTDEWKDLETIEEANAVAIAARKASQKTKVQCRKPYHASVRKPHRSRPFHSTDSTPTGHSTETNPTLDISGANGSAYTNATRGE